MGFVGVPPGEGSSISGHVEEKKQHLRQVRLLWRHGRVFGGAKFIEIACGASGQNNLNLSGGQTVSAVATGDTWEKAQLKDPGLLKRGQQASSEPGITRQKSCIRLFHWRPARMICWDQGGSELQESVDFWKAKNSSAFGFHGTRSCDFTRLG